MAGEEFEVVLHSVSRSGDDVLARLTVRRLPTTTADHFGYWGQELRLPSGETVPAKLHIWHFPRNLRLGRDSFEVRFSATGLSGPAELWMRFFIRGGQGVECLLPLRIPER
ncbi:MAG: hypothetical protein AB1492_05795 [Bacillota bacterium]